MKNFKFLVSLWLLLFFMLGISYGYEQYGFLNYQENGKDVSFSCNSQCLIKLGQKSKVDYLSLKGDISGNGIVGYGFVIGDQVSLLNQYEVTMKGEIDEYMNFIDYGQYLSSIPNDVDVILLFNGNLNGNLDVNASKFTFWQKFKQGRKQASQYYEYNPRTINFLEGPMWNGEYINQYFFKVMIILLIVGIVWCIFVNGKNRKIALVYIFGVLAFFWVSFSFFSTKNQIKIYNDMISAGNVMENGRVGKSSDFYQFLDFIKTKVPNRERGYFIAPYPFDFEGKYHIYPDVKFGNITGVNYIFYYNPYGGEATTSLGFKEPKYSDNTLFRDGNKLNISDVVEYTDYAKIYILKK